MNTAVTPFPVVLVAVSALLNCGQGIGADQIYPPRPPYRIMALTIPSSPSEITGHLSLPEGQGPFAVVVMVGNPGEDDATVADQLARRGVAVVRADPAGFDAAQIGAAAAAAVSRESRIDATRIAFAAFGDAWAIATAAAERAPTVTSLVFLSSGAARSRPLRAVLTNLSRPSVAVVPKSISREGTEAAFFDEMAAWLEGSPMR